MYERGHAKREPALSCDRQKVSCRAYCQCIHNLNRLHSHFLSCRPCSLGCLAVALTLVLTAENHREIQVVGPNKQAYTHECAMQSRASVELAQARPNCYTLEDHSNVASFEV